MPYHFKRGFGDLSLLCAASPNAPGCVQVNPQSTSMFPGWCGWMPGANLFQACQVPTTQALLQANLSNYGAAATPATIASGQTGALTASQQLCVSDPANCAQYQMAATDPNLAAVIGTTPVAQTITQALFNTSTCDPTIDPTCAASGTSTPWMLYGLIAVAGLFGMMALTGGPARYGR